MDAYSIEGAPLLSSDELSRRKLGRAAPRVVTPSLLQRVVALIFMLLVVFVICVASRMSFASLPAPSQHMDSNYNAFSEARARVTLRELAALPRSANTERHTRMGDYLMSTLEQIAAEAPAHNNVTVEMLDRVHMRDVFAVVHGSSASNNSVLVRTTFAAQDNGVGCSVVAEALRNVAAGETPQHNVVFLLEAQEELGNFPGVRRFLESPWGLTVRYFVNFDGREGTKMVMFRTTGSFMDHVWTSAPYCSGSSISDDIGHYLANTDFYYLAGVDYQCRSDDSCPKRQGQDFGFLDTPQTYHTSHDTYSHVPQGSIQAVGEMVLHVVTAAMNSAQISAPLSYSLPAWHQRSVYYDLFGLSGVAYSRAASLALHTVFAALSIALVVLCNVLLRRHWPRGESTRITANTLALTLSFFLSVGAGIGFSKLAAQFSEIFIFRGVDFISVAPSATGASLVFSLCLAVQQRLLRPHRHIRYQLVMWRDFVVTQYFLCGVAVITAIASPFASSTFIVLPMLLCGLLSTVAFTLVSKLYLDRQSFDPTDQVPWFGFSVSFMLVFLSVGALVVPLESLTPLLGTLTYMPELGDLATIIFAGLISLLVAFIFVLSFGFVKQHIAVILTIVAAIFLVAFVAAASVESPYAPNSPRYLDFEASSETDILNDILTITTEDGPRLKKTLNTELSIPTPEWRCNQRGFKTKCTFEVNMTWAPVGHTIKSSGPSEYLLSIERPVLATYVSVAFTGMSVSDISLDGLPVQSLTAVLFDRDRVEPFQVGFRTTTSSSSASVRLDPQLDYRSFPVVYALFNYSLLPDVQYATRYMSYDHHVTKVALPTNLIRLI